MTAEVAGFYPSIPHNEDQDIPKKQYEKFLSKKVSTQDIDNIITQ